MRIAKIEITNVLGIQHLEFRAGRFIKIEGRNGAGKCVPEGTKVALWNGTRKSIEDIRESDLLVGLNRDTHQWQPEHPLRLMTSGTQEVFEVITRTGYRVQLTKNHRLLTTGGWQELHSLHIGSYLAIPMRLPSCPHGTPVSDAEARLIGLMLGDGCFKRGVSLTAADAGIQQQFRESVASMWPDVFLREIVRTNPKTLVKTALIDVTTRQKGRTRTPHQEWSKSIGMHGKGAYDKFIPERIFGAGHRAITITLACLFSTDGSVEEDGWAYYGTRSLDLAKDVRGLLLRAGIASSLHTQRKRKGAGLDFAPFHLVSIITAGGRNRFLCEVMPHMSQSRILPTKRERLDRSRAFSLPPEIVTMLDNMGVPELQAWLKGRNRIGRDRFLRAFSHLNKADQARMKKYASLDVGWDRIVSINPIGQRQTFDLSMPSEAFVASDFLVHNSSVLQAIVAAFGGGNKSHLLRNGTEEGEIVVELDNGFRHITKISANGATKRSVVTADGGTISAAQGWLESRLNPLSFSPIQFVEASNEDRIRQLLRIARLQLRHADLTAAGGRFIVAAPKTTAEFVENPLFIIDGIKKSIFDTRTGINRSRKDKTGHVEELRKTIPAGLDTEPDLSAPRAEYEAVRKQAATERKAIEDKAAADKHAIEQSANNTRTAAELLARDEEKAARAALTQRLSEIARVKEATLKTANEAEKAALAEIASIKATAMESLQERLGPRAEELRETIGKLEQAALQYSAAESTRSSIKRSEDEIAKLDAESKEATAALERLEALKGKLLEALPVPGLEIRDGELWFKGVRFDTTNTAEQYTVAMQLAAAAAGELKIIQLDGVERLDAEKRAAVEAWADGSDCQFWCSRVVDGSPLTLTSELEVADKELAVA